MDPVSASFCGAKWFEGTYWLYQGATASCHHNPFHKIELDPNNPSTLHNTPQKIREREAMLNGEQPSGCNYCWDTESKGSLSDRTFKTNAIPRKRLYEWLKHKPLDNVTPYMIEVAFERTCNLACAYCGPAFSSKWANDIKKNGPYIGLKTDSRYSISNDEDMIDEENNPYIAAFFKWWDELGPTITWCRITGGEPLMSSSFWKFMDILKKGKFDQNLSINSNLVCKKEILERLINSMGERFKTTIHTSIESSLAHTEYIRDGFESDVWMRNVTTVLETKSTIVNRLNFTSSINNLGIWSFIDYLNLMKDLKLKYGVGRVELNCNFVHYPVFMRIELIPLHYRQSLAKEYENWLLENASLCHATEIEHVKRLIGHMTKEHKSTVDSHMTESDALTDLKNFVEQYDNRRDKNFRNVLDPRFVEWYDTL